MYTMYIDIKYEYLNEGIDFLEEHGYTSLGVVNDDRYYKKFETLEEAAKDLLLPADYMWFKRFELVEHETLESITFNESLEIIHFKMHPQLFRKLMDTMDKFNHPMWVGFELLD